MLAADGLYCGALIICWTRLCVTLQVSHGPRPIPAHDHTITGAHHKMSGSEMTNRLPHPAPCFVDDIFAALRESVGNDGEVTDHSLRQFGVCTVSDQSSGAVLLGLSKLNHRNGLHPSGVVLAEEEERGTLELTFDLPQSPLRSNPVLLLVFEWPLAGGNLDATFTSQSLQPNTQSVCISGETQYIMLTGTSLESNIHQKWRISIDTKSPDMKQSLKDILIGGKSGSAISMSPFLLFSGERGTDTRYAPVSGSSLSSSQTSSFLCELKRFLGDVMPQDHPESSPLQLSSLQSLPPMTLDTSSSEILLAELINSSTLTIFSFASCCSTFQVHRGELALSPALLEELSQRLEQIVMKTMEVIREEEVDPRAAERLGRLIGLSVFPKQEPAAGERQYWAFLLLKALQTVARMYEVKRALRATRAGSNNPVRGDQCGLRSLTVSLEKQVIGPNTANIHNCHGSCAVPLVNPSNHAVLLNAHIESEGENVGERAPCCVPVAYEDLDLVFLNAQGTGTELKRLNYVVARECGCR